MGVQFVGGLLIVLYSMFVVQGIVWPSEAMPKWLLYISYGLPTTYAAKSMRSIMGRGTVYDTTVSSVN